MNNTVAAIASPIFPRFLTRYYRAAVALWFLFAVVNLSAGIVIASRPERQFDLDLMHGWTTEWLVDGTDIYTSVGERDYPDYPPHAIVALSPLALLSEGWVVPVWALANICLAVLATYLAVLSVRPLATVGAPYPLPLAPYPLPLAPYPLPLAPYPLLIFMLLTWGGFRTLLQFTLFSVTFGLLAMVLCERPLLGPSGRVLIPRTPLWSGICLALAMSKPQVGAPFLLWVLFTRRVRTLSFAVAAVVAIFGVYCIRANANPVQVVARYFETLWEIYTGNTVLIGLAQLRPLLTLVFSDFSLIDTLAIVLALLMLALVVVIGFTEGRDRHLIFCAPALAGLWSLLTFYNLTYSFIVLLPAAALLLLIDDPPTARLRKPLFWMLQVGMMVDIPGVWRRAGPFIGGLSGSAWINALAIHFDRILMLILFAGVLRLAIVDRRSSIVDGRRIPEIDDPRDDGRSTMDDGR